MTIVTVRGQILYAVEFGPFTLASPTPFTTADIEGGREVFWEQLGFILDARTFGNDFERVRRYVVAYMKLECGFMGTEWAIGADEVAMRIHLDDEPRFVDINRS
jgi:hypothetical protein